MRTLLLLLVLAACDVDSPLGGAEIPCDERRAWYPVDGADEVYLSCDDPGEGWTLDPPPLDTDGSW